MADTITGFLAALVLPQVCILSLPGSDAIQSQT
jgi:hypothetical protein